MNATPSDRKPGSAGSVLHVGCGGDPLPDFAAGYVETRLDIDPRHSPDVVASMTDMGDIGPFDLLICMHALEHLYPHEVPVALSEFLRVLAPGGKALVVVPDLEGVEPTEEVVLHAPCGPITGLDLIYGYRPTLAEMPHMAHHTGFVRETLDSAMRAAGFAVTETKRDEHRNLISVGLKA